MIYLKWAAICFADWLLLLTLPVVAPFVLLAYWLLPVSLPAVVIGLYCASALAIPVIAAFTQAQPFGKESYSWGWIWGTYDNPPQGDEGFVKKRCPFPTHLHGLKGYINRVVWMLRNPFYGFARWAALDYSPDYVQHLLGKDGISDKDKIPGWYFVRLHDVKRKRMVGFEFYGVFPYTNSRNVRIRLGWKILTDKFKEKGFAQFVNTFNPVDGYGDN